MSGFRPANLVWRNLCWHWRSQLAVLLGAATATAVLTGALLVGDALRGTLRDAALDRLGTIAVAVQSPTFFRAALADELRADPAVCAGVAAVREAVILRGAASRADRTAHVADVQIIALPGPAPVSTRATQVAQSVSLNRTLADELRVAPGDEIVLRLAPAAAISPETLLGRREAPPVTLRLEVAPSILDSRKSEPGAQARDDRSGSGFYDFSLRPTARTPRNAFVHLETLQRALGRPGQANTLLLAHDPGGAAPPVGVVEAAIRRHARLADYGLRLTVAAEHGYVALESSALLLSLPAENAGRCAAAELGWPASGVLVQLANEMQSDRRPERSVPYSTVAAVEPDGPFWAALRGPDRSAVPVPAAGEIVLNEWAARELSAAVGDDVRLSYYTVAGRGELRTQRAAFRVAAVAALAGPAADAGFAPEYPGVTDARRLSDWDPPFPIDLARIRPQDEVYWDMYRATPKAFVRLDEGQRLWADAPHRFGRLTALRVYPPAGAGSLEEVRARFETALCAQLDPAACGVTVEPVRELALAAARGTTDFGALFTAFSVFLIASAAMLVTLLLRLAIERRGAELGVLLATGWTPRRVAALVLGEQLVVLAGGITVGLAAAGGYAWLMLAGLRGRWAAAARGPELVLHLEPTSFAIGAVAGTAVGLAAVLAAVRGVSRRPPRALLAGAAFVDTRIGRHDPEVAQRAQERGALRAATTRRGGAAPFVPPAARIVPPAGAGAAAVLLMVLAYGTQVIPETAAFFSAGVLLLVAGLAALRGWLRCERSRQPVRPGYAALARLGARNAQRHPGRSLLTAGLVACAVFILAAVEAARLDPAQPEARKGGTAGFALLAETALPVLADLNTNAGRAAVGLPESDPDLDGVRLFPLRLRAGDETSCLSPYRPLEPRIVGAPAELIERGGFEFAAVDGGHTGNPWELLNHDLADGAVPAIADEAAALWQLHVGLGEDVVIQDERGREVRLRLVALLRNSVLQGELIVGEPHFTRLFPSLAGYRFFLIDAPAGRAAAVEQRLETGLAELGFVATRAMERLGELMAVQNTYIDTFQMLGSVGLLLGALGLAVVMLRNVGERRGELALLRAVGFGRPALGVLVLSENALLVGGGLAIGVVAALVATGPRLLESATALNVARLAGLLALVLAIGLLVGAAALARVLRTPLLPALRAE